MYKLNPLWTDFYRETEPERRRQLLKRTLEEVPDDGANACRVRLFECRHKRTGKQEHEVDLLLWQCVNFIQVYASARFFKRKARKDVESCLAAIGYDEAADFGEVGRQAHVQQTLVACRAILLALVAACSLPTAAHCSAVECVGLLLRLVLA